MNEVKNLTSMRQDDNHDCRDMMGRGEEAILVLSTSIVIPNHHSNAFFLDPRNMTSGSDFVLIYIRLYFLIGFDNINIYNICVNTL